MPSLKGAKVVDPDSEMWLPIDSPEEAGGRPESAAPSDSVPEEAEPGPGEDGAALVEPVHPARPAQGHKAAESDNGYAADQIQVLEGLDPVRRRP
ncbi:MAG: hypothetical protein ACYCYK_04550, partial [Candidatus Dormibacteria bacterium]